MKIAKHILSLLLVALMLAGIVLSRDAKILGNNINFNNKSEINYDSLYHKSPEWKMVIDSLTRMGINNADVHLSSDYVKDIQGYAGPTPLYIASKKGKIVAIIAGENYETPGFWNRVLRTNILNSWNGLTFKEAIDKKVDAVSGATFSSTSIINTLQSTLLQISESSASISKVKRNTAFFTLKNISVLLVLLFGLYISFFQKKGAWRTVMLILNIVVLGLWSGYFISMTILTNWMSSGSIPIAALIVFIMLIMTIVLSFVGKKNYYCTNVCPYGSAQQLLGKVKKKKWKIPFKYMKYLRYSRKVILSVILILMWTGVTFRIMDYEVFSVFLFESASIGIIIFAVTFLILSIFIPRPYCRFLCLTGQILNWSENIKI